MNTHNKFNTTNLGSIAKVQTGPFGSQLHEKDYVEKGTPIITVEHLGYGRIIKNDIPCVSESDVLRLKKFLLKTGDIVFSRVGSVDRSVLIRQEEDGWMFSGRCLRVRVTTKDVLPAYLYYYFTQNSFRQYVRNNAVGATMPSLKSSILRRLKILYPALSKQKQIVDVLSTIDDTFANNYTRIQLLEESSRLLFREWFVYFRFPRLRQGFGGQAGHEKACPVESRNSTGVKIVDGVPEGWEKGPIKKYFDTTSGGTPSRNVPEFYQGDINWVKTQELDEKYIFDTDERVTQEAINKSSAKIFPENTLLVSIYGNTNIGRTGIIAKPAASNQACVAFFPKKQYFHYIYLQQYLQMIRNYLVGLSQGAAQTNISQDTLRKVNILMPDELLMNKFLKIVEPIYEQIKNLQYQNQKLAQARDLLLPRLMSGAIEV